MNYLESFCVGFIFSFFNINERIYAQPQEDTAACPVLSIGEVYLLKPPKFGRIWIENGKILKAEAKENQVQLKAMSQGSTLIRIGHHLCRIHVLTITNYFFWQSLKSEITKMIGLEVRLENGLPAIKGRLFSIQDWFTIQQAAPQSGNYKMLALINHKFQNEIQLQISKLLKQSKLPPANLTFGDRLTIKIKKDKDIGSKMRELLGSWGIEIEEDSNSIQIEPLIKVEITVAEVLRDSYSKIGITWPTEFSAQVLPSLKPTASTLNVLGEFFESQGVGKILASPNILCRTGKEAEFLAGGEIPIRVGGQSKRTAEIVWKKYGILLRVKPLADSSGRMSIEIETEVSHIDPSRTVENIPGLISNKMTSHFDLKSPRIIALSGLIRQNEGENLKGLSGLSDLPILGRLFSSKNFQANRSELVIFVRPSLIEESPELNQGSDLNTKPKHLIENSNLNDLDPVIGHLDKKSKII